MKKLLFALLVGGCTTLSSPEPEPVLSTRYNEVVLTERFDYMRTGKMVTVDAHLYKDGLTSKYVLLVYADGDFIGQRKLFDSDLNCINEACLSAKVKNFATNML